MEMILKFMLWKGTVLVNHNFDNHFYGCLFIDITIKNGVDIINSINY